MSKTAITIHQLCSHLICDHNANLEQNFSQEDCLRKLNLILKQNKENTLDSIRQIMQDKTLLDVDSLLFLALQKEYSNSAELLINECGCNINTTDAQGNTLISVAIKNNQTNIADLLTLKEPGFNVQKNKNVPTSILVEQNNGKDKAEELSLEKETDLNAQNAQGDTALHLAVKSRDKQLIANLILQRVNVNAKNAQGDTALHLASYIDDINIIEALLVAEDINLNEKNNYGDTALHISLPSRNPAVINALLLKGANVDEKNSDGKTALHIAVCLKQNKNFVALLEKADINAQNNQGNTALHIATQIDRKEIVNGLLDKGADINAQNNQGNTALHIAIEQRHIEIVELLLSKGADINVRNNQGDTALQQAQNLQFYPRYSKEIIKLINYYHASYTGTGFVIGSLIGAVLAGIFVVGKMIATGIALLAAFSAFSIILPALGILLLSGIIGGFIGYLSSSKVSNMRRQNSSELATANKSSLINMCDTTNNNKIKPISKIKITEDNAPNKDSSYNEGSTEPRHPK